MAEVKENTEKRYSQAELEDMVQKAVAEALAKFPMHAAQPAQIVQVTRDEFVTLLYVGVNCKGTVVAMPEWGSITFSGGTLDVPKREFIHGLGRQTNADLLKKRKVLVIDGLTPEERVRFGVDYKPDEVLTRDAFMGICKYPKKKVCEIFEKLCPEHKELVARLYSKAYFEDDERLDPAVIKALNNLSKDEKNKQGMFIRILKDMGEKFAEENDDEYVNDIPEEGEEKENNENTETGRKTRRRKEQKDSA